MAQEQQRRRVGPVAVLEHEQHRPPAADACEQVGDRRVEAMALGVRIGLDRLAELADQGRQIRRQPGQLARAGAERGAQLCHIDDPQEAVERLDEGPVGRAHDRVAGAVEDERPIRRDAGGELARQAALAGTGLTGEQQRRAGPRPRRAAAGVPQLLQLGGTADERIGRAESGASPEARDLGVHATNDSQV